jgi:hypothetical protein
MQRVRISVRHPCRVPGTGFGFTAGASVGRLEGRASGIRDISDVAGKYEAVGAGGAMVGGFGCVHLRNDKGVTIDCKVRTSESSSQPTSAMSEFR